MVVRRPQRLIQLRLERLNAPGPNSDLVGQSEYEVSTGTLVRGAIDMEPGRVNLSSNSLRAWQFQDSLQLTQFHQALCCGLD
jgi:hypothetical protein